MYWCYGSSQVLPNQPGVGLLYRRPIGDLQNRQALYTEGGNRGQVYPVTGQCKGRGVKGTAPIKNGSS